MQVVAGRYRIIELVGAGGTSQVFKAEDRLTREVVALKRLYGGPHRFRHMDTSADGGEALGLALEFRALAGLRHPHIVPVLDYGFDEQRQPFLTMPLVAPALKLTDAARALDERGKAE
jgi:serine/threonine protein kinase